MAPSEGKASTKKSEKSKAGHSRSDKQGVFTGPSEAKQEVQDEDDTEGDVYPRTHVCVPKVLAVVRKHQQINRLTGSFFRYLTFIAVYIAVVTVQRDAEVTQSTQTAIKNYMMAGWRDPDNLTIKNFMDVRTVPEFWDFLSNFNGNLMQQSYADGEAIAPQFSNTLLQHNRLTGNYRLLQRRVKGKECTFWETKYSLFFPRCYGRAYIEGLIGDVDMEEFVGSDGVTKYKYEERDQGSELVGKDHGFFIDFGVDSAANAAAIADLRSNRWINEGTSWVRADFVVYNSNVGLFVAVMMKIEFDPSGVTIPEYYTEAIASTTYSTWTDFIRLAGEILTVVFFLFYLIANAHRAIAAAREAEDVWAYFKDMDNNLVVLQLLFFVVIFALMGAMLQNGSRQGLQVSTESILTATGKPPNFSGLALLSQIYFIVNGLNVFIALIKTMGFMRINANLSQLTDTIALMASDLLQFAMVLAVLVLAFMLMAHSMFGTSLRNFSNITDAAVSTIEFLMGNGDFFALSEADPIAAPIFYFPFVFVMIFVVLNITIAIIMDGYERMRDNREQMKTSHLKALAEKPFFTQVREYLLDLFSFAQAVMPQEWKEIKTESGVTLDRFAAPKADEVVSLLVCIEEDDIDGSCLPIEVLKKKLGNFQTTEERIEAIFDRFDGWTDPNKNNFSGDETVSDRVAPNITQLRDSVLQVLKEQALLESKVAVLLKAFPA
mmetsp:Transcript_28016/g.65205  ORF Transcript_28016/g.65205 Transcript_28016/m.65205 type:complete len:718 (+) Transcript_28016:321-2474(+)